LNVSSYAESNSLTLSFENSGRKGAVLHVYDKLHLDRIPRRYTIEAGKSLKDQWPLATDQGRYDLWVYGPNGFVREFRGTLNDDAIATPEIELHYDKSNKSLELTATNHGTRKLVVTIQANAYHTDGPWTLHIPTGQQITHRWSLAASHRWYDFTVTTTSSMERRFAGRMEDGTPGVSDPAV